MNPRGRSPNTLRSTPVSTSRSTALTSSQAPIRLSRRLIRGSPEEYVAAGSSYIAYSGRFFVDEVKRSLSHEMAVSFFPNWLGQRQVRLVEVDSERLQLSTDGPQRFNGTLKTAKISWRRAKPNF